jgi:muramoyltetrapeptide carboxypeptidase LdcA involved in peptidoglycan recycling
MDSNEHELGITLCYLQKALNAHEEYEIHYQSEAKKLWKPCYTINRGIATGRLIGGNLSTLAELPPNIHCDVGRQPGDIILLEEVEPYYFIKDSSISGSMHGNLLKLKKRGIFDNINGLIIGRSKLPQLIEPDKKFSMKV